MNNILAIGRYNSFVSRSISELSKYSNLDALIFTRKENVSFSSNVRNIKIFNISNFFSIIYFYNYIYKIRNNYDAFIFYYMQDYFSILLNLNIINKPKYYFPFGSDLHKTGIRRFLLKYSLFKFKKIFIELETQKEYIISHYEVPKEIMESSLIIFNVDSCFHLIKDEQINSLKTKWNISKQYIIVSPRSINYNYNHHLIIKGLGCLHENVKDNVELIIIGPITNSNTTHTDIKYLNYLLKLGKRLNVNITHINKYLTSQEMSEIYNISNININIPKTDQFGHSIIEGCLCGSIPLLSDKIKNYHELMQENTNCIYTNETAHDIARKTEYIITNYNNIKYDFFTNNYNKLSPFMNKDENSNKLIQYISNNINE